MRNEQELPEGMDNTTGIAQILETGDLEEAQSILGDREKIRYAGIIRAGVKVPKKNCKPQELALFKKLEAEGLPYDEIDRQMGGTPKSKDSKLFPTNTDYFVIRQCDFRRESDADLIMERYADKDGHVRRIPIWLTVGDLDKVVPHNFREFDGSGNVKAFSYYEGKNLMLKYVPKGTKPPYKKEDWKTCTYDPDDPPKDAPPVKFGGLYKVNIPGLKGLGEIVVPTRSWYGLGDAVAQLRRVRSLLGRFNGLLNGEPFLELCKVEETVRTPEGEKQKQWIITVELAIDPMELARYAEPTQVAARAQHAMRMLTGRTAAPSSAPQPSAVPPVDALAQGQAKTDPKVKAAITALEEMVEKASITPEQIRSYVVFQYDGQCLDDMTVDELTAVYKAVRLELHKDRDVFVATVNDIHRDQPSLSDDLPFGN